MATFLGELEEHVRTLNRDLLALEKDTGEGRAELLVSLFRTVHSLKGAARSVSVEAIETACHRLESLIGAARDGRRPLDADAIELVYATADALKDAGERLRAGQDLSGGRLQSVLPDFNRATQSPRTASPSLSQETASVASTPPTGTPLTHEGFVRVQVQKLDALLITSGEALVARRRVMSERDDALHLHHELRQWRTEWTRIDKPIRHALASHPRVLSKRARLALEGAGERLRSVERHAELLSSRLEAGLHSLERAAATLDAEIRRVRMFPFSHACEGLERTVRDLARTGTKQAVLVIEGGEIEAGRLVLEGLKDPLLHLVRNAIDHGIETPEQRVAAGKTANACVTVAAALRSGALEVVVADDGRGLDMEAIRAQARRRKLRIPGDHHEAAGLVFQPGFSTMRLVTAISGRGMGLDVVKHQIESLHGQVDISFQPGHGTRVVMTVPLTVMAIRALLLRAAGQIFALPVTHVQRLIRAAAADLGSVGGREVLLSADAPIPVVPLTDILGMPSAAATSHSGHRVPLVVVASGNTRAAIAVDELRAEEEILVKNLGPRLRRVRHFAGATILPSGRVALILNTADLLSSALQRAPSRTLAATLTKDSTERRQRILLAEDSLTTRSLEKSILESAGYDVVAAADGSDAWRILQERGADLVVADVEMPRMDGFALCEAIRRSPRFRELPIVLVTALETATDKARGLEIGADAYLPKSAFDQRKLLDTIAQLL